MKSVCFQELELSQVVFIFLNDRLYYLITFIMENVNMQKNAKIESTHYPIIPQKTKDMCIHF